MKTNFYFNGGTGKFFRFMVISVLTTNLFLSSCEDKNSPNTETNSDWAEVGSLNANNTISCLCSDGTNIYAAGKFTNADGKHYVAKWNGSNWSTLGDFTSNEEIDALWADSKGNVYADAFFQEGTNWYRYVAMWNGTQWTNLGNLNVNSAIYSIFADSNGNVYAAGKFTNNEGKYYVAKWDGTKWQEVGKLNANGNINVVRATDDGKIFAAGAFTNDSGKCYVALWNGTTWVNSGMLTQQSEGGEVNALCRDNNGNFYAAGSFSNPGSNGKCFLARWNNGEQKAVPGSEVNGPIAVLTTDGNNIFVGGDFTNNSFYHYVAKWDGTSFSELGNLKANARIIALCTDAAGNVYAAGDFTNSSEGTYISENPFPGGVFNNNTGYKFVAMYKVK